MKKTEKRRGDDQLLISYKAPNKAIGSQTLSGWFCKVLTKAGVSMEYTGHSTRLASTSKVANSGVSIELQKFSINIIIRRRTMRFRIPC